ncbi:MAG TPA: glycosyltransferase [Methylocystis sp.]|nr:glycosyltransferase [Methylocystis sp.]
MLPITLVTATRLNRSDFMEKSALGRSLSLTYRMFQLKLIAFFDNTEGLGTCYNKGIAGIEDDEEVIVLTHDDVLLTDFFWVDKLLSGFTMFDVLGVAGNRRRVPRQPAWAFIDDKLTWDDRSNLSGVVGHGDGFPCRLSIYGEVFKNCKLLDGVFIAAKKKTFRENNVIFDEQFKFHFYDMDLCRQLEQKNISMGTIPLGLIHASGGSFGRPEWRESYEIYLAKWND